MLEDSLDFISKKPLLQNVTLNVNTVQLIHNFSGSVPTTFDEHCRMIFGYLYDGILLM